MRAAQHGLQGGAPDCGTSLRTTSCELKCRPPDVAGKNSGVGENTMNLKCREASEWNSPPQLRNPQPRRGGCAVKKKSRSHLSPRRRRGVDKPNTFCGPTPPRPLHQRWLRSIFLDV